MSRISSFHGLTVYVIVTPKTSCKKKQRHRAESEESDDEGGYLDSDRSFTLAALDRVLHAQNNPDPAAISHIGTRWNAAANKGTIASLMRESVVYHNENGIDTLAIIAKRLLKL